MRNKKSIQPDYTELKIKIPTDTAQLILEEKIENYLFMFPSLMQLFKPMHEMFCEISEERSRQRNSNIREDQPVIQLKVIK